MYERKMVINRYSIEKILPLYCAAVVYKNIYNYFIYLFPFLESVGVLLYNAVTLMGLLLYIPLFLHALLHNKKYKIVNPAILIPLCVLVNILFVYIETGDLTILSRGHFLSVANGTNDERGYYFSQINTWFGNISVVLMLSIFSTKIETIKKCIISSMVMLFVPSILMMIFHPEFLGMRQSSIEGSDVTFSGGLWNIGVMGIGSISWLGLALYKDMTRWHKRVVLISVITFAFLGVAGLSRTLIIMLALSACCYFMIAKKDSRLISKVFVIVFAVIIFAVVESDLISSILLRFNDSTSGTQNIRFLLWKAYLSHFDEVWLWGAPYGSVYNYYYDVSLIGAHFLPHSSVINFLIRFGLLCACSYLVLIKRAFFTVRQNKTVSINQIACIRAGCMAYVSLAFINQTGYAEPIFYVMFGLLLAYSQLMSEEAKKEKYEGRNNN